MLSIIIVTYNSEGHIEACLRSVLAQGLDGVEVLVVDNGSSDGTRRIIKDLFPEVRLIENSDNKGAAEARNQAIAQAQGAWVLTLDSDVVLDAGFIRAFHAIEMTLPSDVGMVQGNILDGDRGRIYSQGIYLSPLRRFFDVNRGRAFPCVNNRALSIIGPCAAAGFYRRSMLEQVKEATGYFDRRFFFLVEDVDLAWRAKRAGWKTVFAPELVCVHQGNGSRTGHARRQELCRRNRHWMIAKNEGWLGRIWVYLISWPYEAARGVYFLINHIKRTDA